MSRLYTVLNIQPEEWPRISKAWLTIFLSRFGFIVGWSTLTALFLSKVGIQFLPTLFLANALLVVFGTFLFKPLTHRFSKELLMAFSLLTAVSLLLTAALLFEIGSLGFFILVLIAESIALAQFLIQLSLFNESLFSPSESQRAFPLIESAEIFGGVVGGLTLTLLANEIASYKFILIWGLALLAILPIILSVPGKSEHQSKKSLHGLMKAGKRFHKTPFLKSLMLLMLLHWGIMNLIEFQYTKAIQQNIYEQQEETLLEQTDVILAEESHNYEQEIAHQLGVMHFMFNSFALALQLLLASRILTQLGIASSILVHPIMTIMTGLALFLRFGLFTAVLARGSYELTGLLFKSAYDASYYAVPHENRSDMKELCQGIMKPVGAILGTVIIVAIALTTDSWVQSALLNGIILILSLTMILLARNLNKKFTQLCEQNLDRKWDTETRANAIEVLAQNGHEGGLRKLKALLKSPNESIEIKKHVLKTLSQREEKAWTFAILELLKHPHVELREEAALCLKKRMENPNLRPEINTHRKLLEKIEDFLEKEESILAKSLLAETTKLLKTPALLYAEVLDPL